MKNVLLTGANGRVGKVLRQALRGVYPLLRVTDLTPLGAAASDKIVARIGLSWLKVNVVGDTRYQQFIVKDPSMSAWDMKP